MFCISLVGWCSTLNKGNVEPFRLLLLFPFLLFSPTAHALCTSHPSPTCPRPPDSSPLFLHSPFAKKSTLTPAPPYIAHASAAAP